MPLTSCTTKVENGETYNIGGFNEWTNIDLIKVLCAQMDEKLGREKGSSEKLITYVKDRPGHDRRYAIDATKINKELGWAPSVTFEEGLAITIDWYLEQCRVVEKRNLRDVSGVLRQHVRQAIVFCNFALPTKPSSIYERNHTCRRLRNATTSAHLSCE